VTPELTDIPGFCLLTRDPSVTQPETALAPSRVWRYPCIRALLRLHLL
jgi:hypothetical protein